jgi:HPt (histidine-containing phosphotransfer) domain-containing protein
MKEHFHGNMRNEINTPMHYLLGMIDLLLNAGLTEKQCRIAEAVRTSGQELCDTINDILDLLEIEAGKLSGRSVPPDSQALSIDRKVLDEIRAFDGNGNSELAERLISVYIENSPKFIKELNETAANGDHDALQMTAHTFKSSSLSLGAMTLASLCDQLKHCDHHPDNGAVSELIVQIEAEHKRVVAALQRELHCTEP